MKTISCLLLFSMIFYSCTSVHMIPRSQTTYDNLNKQASEKRVEILLRDDEVIYAKKIHMDVDSTSLVEIYQTGQRRSRTETFRNRSISTSTINELSIIDHGKGVKEGLGYGMIVAVTAGLLGLLSGDSQEGWIRISAGQKAIAFGTIFGGIGVLIGLALGTSKGHKDTYIFSLQEDSTYINTKINQKLESPVLLSNGFYHVNVSSLKDDSELIIVTWQGKEIRLRKSKVKQIWKIGDRIYIRVPAELYESKFVEE